jgi:hypothetical protein
MVVVMANNLSEAQSTYDGTSSQNTKTSKTQRVTYRRWRRFHHGWRFQRHTEIGRGRCLGRNGKG